MATIDLRRLDTNRVGTSPIANGSDITWGEILTAVGSGQSLDKVLRDLYDQGLVKFTFTDGTVAQDVAGNPYRSLSAQSYSAAQKGKTVRSIEVEGSSGKDTIYGTEGAETIRAGSGDDLVIGGRGADMQTGGRGKDTFAYKAAGDSETGTFDTITDFKASEGDRIDLSALGQITWGGQKSLGGGTASAWYTVNGPTASLWIDVDGNGSADMRIDLKGVTSIAQTDLIGVSKPATPLPPLPTANATPDTASITEDAKTALVSGNVLANDGSGLTLTTVNGQKLSTLLKAAFVTGKHGTLTIGQDGKWVYTLNNKDAAVQDLGVGETLTETFTYVATGKNGATATSTLTVTIKGSNDGPVAVKDAAGTDEAAAVDIAVLANDTDRDGDGLVVSSATVTTGKGTVSVNPDNTLRYDPADAYDALRPGETAQVVITYRIADGKGGTATSTATVTVVGKANGGVQTVSDPVGLSTIAGTDQVDTVVYSGAISVGSEDQPFVLPEAIENFDVAGGGSLNIKGNALNNVFGLGTAKGDNVDLSAGGSDSVTGKAAELDGATITGFGTDDTIVVEGASTVRIVDVTAGSAILHLDTNGDDVADTTISLEGDGLDGSKLNPDDFAITSAAGGSAIAFAPTNVAPLAQDGTGTAAEDTVISGKVTATDGDEDTLTYSLVAGPAAEKGTLAFNADGTYTFTPAQDFNGEVAFTYKANDGAANSNVATVTLTVHPANDAPTAAPISAEGDEEGVITGTVTGSDRDGETLTYKLAGDGAPKNGTVTVNADGTFSYRGNDNFSGADVFTVEVSDGKGGTATTDVSVTVNPSNDAPVAAADMLETSEDTPLTIAASDLAKNDSDDERDVLTVSEVAQGSNGQVSLVDGQITYTPNPDFHGTDTFTYTVSDGQTATTGTVTVTVAPRHDAPVAQDGAAEGDEDTVIAGSVKATDPDSASLTYSVVEAPQAVQGTLEFEPDGHYTFTPAADFSGTVTFTYKANDGTEDSNVATVNLTVRPVNNAPVAADDAATTMAGEAVTIEVLHNDTDADGGPNTVESFTQATGGVVAKDDRGNLVYTPDAGFTGPDSFTYTVNGGSTATVTVNVQSVEVPELPLLSVSNATWGEQEVVGGNDEMVFTFTLSSPSATDVTFKVRTKDGTANGVSPEGSDYFGIVGGPGDGVITIPAGQTSTTFAVAIRDDVEVEADEAFTVEVYDVVGATPGAAGTGTITDNDEEAPVELPAVTLGDAIASEADGVIKIPFTLSHVANNPITLTYEMSAPGKVIDFDNAGSLNNYEGLRWENVALSSDPFVVPSGAPALVMGTEGGGWVRAIDSAKNFGLSSVNLSSPYTNQVGGAQQVTITGYDDGDVVGTKTVTLTDGSPVDVAFGPEFASIDAFHIDSPEVNGVDVPAVVNSMNLSGGAPITRTVTLPAGAATGTIDIPIENDGVYEVGEKVTIKLTDAEGATLGGNVEAVGTITNDDAHPLPRI